MGLAFVYNEITKRGNENKPYMRKSLDMIADGDVMRSTKSVRKRFAVCVCNAEWQRCSNNDCSGLKIFNLDENRFWVDNIDDNRRAL